MDLQPATRSTTSSTFRGRVPRTVAAAAVAGAMLGSCAGGVLTQTPAATAPLASIAVVRRPAGTYARAQIPWSQVGSGWIGVVVVPISTATKTDLGATPGTLYLVSPEGARYAIGATQPGVRVSDVAPDGRRVLTTRGDGGTREVVTQVWDSQTGVAHTVATGMANAQFSRPQGTAVIGTVLGSDGALHLQRYDLDGRLQLTYFVPGGQTPTFEVRPPDGLSLVVSTQTGVAVLGNATGAVVREIPMPPGAFFCLPISMWTTTHILVSCSSTTIGSAASDLYTVPVAGGSMTRMALIEPQDTNGRHLFGFVGAWRSTVGVVLQRGADCGNVGYAMLHPDGRVTDLRFPEKSTSEGGPVVVSVVGSTAFLSVTNGEGGCGGVQYQTLVSHDLATGASHPLVGPLAGTGALYGWPVVIEPTP